MNGTVHRRRRRLHPGWSAAILFTVVAVVFVLTAASFAGWFTSYVPVTMTSDRAGLIMESGAKVKMRGVAVGRVGGIDRAGSDVRLDLHIDPERIADIPANVEAEIQASTLFGAKFVNLVYPAEPTARRLARGAVLRARNVTTEVNTVFENLVGVLERIDPAKLNAILTALAEGVRGRGPQLGAALSDARTVVVALNERSPALTRDIAALRGFSDTYGAAAGDLLTVLDAAATAGDTLVAGTADLDGLLLNVSGLARSGIDLLAPNRDNLVRAVNDLEPTTALLLRYNPILTCTLLGAKWFLDNGGGNIGANGRTGTIDAGLGLGDDPYRYPENLPKVAATGGPGGRPGCGSLPDASANYPVRYLVTDTGWGAGLDVRPNPGIGHPWWVNYFPVTRAVPEPPSVRGEGPPAPGPAPGPPPPPPAPAPAIGTPP
ncbi:MCE family protein [Mycobacterium manitobense]|uniref:MCE family protein n=1 Tax=[Mycobacterium] manitobense TaxID=190147 RepID=A0A9X3BM58_9MYCO|nr:MCE family protein [[Mycobacterium] manitobense]MCV7169590.1 MCE family protein [[Mycobacterium] manitobense]